MILVCYCIFPRSMTRRPPTSTCGKRRAGRRSCAGDGSMSCHVLVVLAGSHMLKGTGAMVNYGKRRCRRFVARQKRRGSITNGKPPSGTKALYDRFYNRRIYELRASIILPFPPALKAEPFTIFPSYLLQGARNTLSTNYNRERASPFHAGRAFQICG